MPLLATHELELAHRRPELARRVIQLVAEVQAARERPEEEIARLRSENPTGSSTTARLSTATASTSTVATVLYWLGVPATG